MSLVPGQGILSSSGGRNTKKDRPDAREVSEFHVNADTDGSPKSLHHTLGPGPNQAAAGNHSHDAGASSGLSGYSLATHTHPGLNVVTAWTAPTLLNGWLNYGGVFDNAAYRKVGDEVECRGLVKSGTVATDATGNVFVLPAGFRPTNQLVLVAPISAGMIRMDVFPDGSVRAMSSFITGGTVAFCSLMLIRFSTL